MQLEIDPKLFTFSEDIQVRWTDLDPLGHVNNSIYIQYFEIARGKYMLQASSNWNWHEHMFLLANVNCNYLSELKIGMPKTKCWVRTKEIGRKSFILEYMITTEDNKVHTIGTSTQVMFDTKNKQTIAVAEWFKKDLLNYEKENSIHLK